MVGHFLSFAMVSTLNYGAWLGIFYCAMYELQSVCTMYSLVLALNVTFIEGGRGSHRNIIIFPHGPGPFPLNLPEDGNALS